MNLKFTFVDAISKNGNSYTALDILFPNGFKKRVFFNSTELFIIDELRNKNSNSEERR